MYNFKGLLYCLRKLDFRRKDVLLQVLLIPVKPVNLTSRLFCDVTNKSTQRVVSILDPVQNLDLSGYGSVLSPAFNLAAYADKSKILQELIKLGVELYKLENMPDVGKTLVSLNYEKEFKPIIVFLSENGVPSEKLGKFITVNPLVFKIDLNDLEVRLNYLKAKKFSKEMISNIITNNPKWLSVSVKQIDERLGFLQQSFDLKGDEVRNIVSQVPSLGTLQKKRIITNIHALTEELELDKICIKKMVLASPIILRTETTDLLNTYLYISKVMKVPKYLITKQPEVLRVRKFRLQERHKFLELLGRAQYNPLLPGYISLKVFALCSDTEFCENVAKASIHVYNEFLKTL